MVPVTVQRALSITARRRPDKVALRFGAEAITYRQLDARSNGIARALLGLGLRAGDRVAAMLPNSPDYVALAYACAKARLCMVPVNYRFTSDEIRTQLQDCGASAFVHGSAFGAQVNAARLGEGVMLVSVGEANPDSAMSMPAPGPTPTTDRQPRRHAVLDQLVAAASTEPLPFDAREDDLFYLGYTSGTTGKPKGAMVNQRNRALAYHYWALEFGIGSDEVALHCGPFHHTAPFTFTLTQLFMGGEVVILDAFDAVAAVDAIGRYGVNWAFMVPFMLDRVLEECARTDLHSASLRMLISGASPLPTRTKQRVMARFPGASLHEFYGATEAGVVTNLRHEDQARKVRCVGQPVAEIEIDIRDETGRSVAKGEVGDIWLRGPTLFAGYFDAPDKTAAVTDGDWCTLGDIGRVDDEGYLYLIDRRKDVIKSGGVNIYPIEIEEVLLQEPRVRECAVVGLADERWGEAVHAFVVLADAGAQDEVLTRLARLCRDALAGYKQPKHFHVLPALPRNANGKVLKRDLREGAPLVQD